jgi:predicted enzyme related to lactoylglutathione lyase
VIGQGLVEMSPSGPRRLSLVCLTVSDVERAIEFYVEKLGFEADRVARMGGARSRSSGRATLTRTC